MRGQFYLEVGNLNNFMILYLQKNGLGLKNVTMKRLHCKVQEQGFKTLCNFKYKNHSKYKNHLFWRLQTSNYFMSETLSLTYRTYKHPYKPYKKTDRQNDRQTHTYIYIHTSLTFFSK